MTNFESHSLGADFDLRVTPVVSVKGEVWTGSNLSDVRGGVGQALNVVLGREIDSHGGWAELGVRRGSYGFSTGYLVDDPDDGDVPVSGVTQNRAWYVTNQFRVAQPVTAGIDYIYWRTRYKGVDDGTDNRVNAYIAFTF